MSVNTLLNTKWQINTSLQPPQGGIGPLDLQFSSNSTEYTSLELEDNQNSLDIYYNSTHVFDTNTWSNQNYRTIYIYGGTDVTDSDMIDWLEEYATQLDVDVRSVNADWLDANMRLASNAIRAKGGASSTINCPEGLSSAINNIPTGSGVNITGTTEVSAKAVGNVTVGDTVYICSQYDMPPLVTATATRYSCAFSPDGTRLAVGAGASPYLYIYDTTTVPYTKLADPSTKPTGTVNGLSWSPDGTRLAVAHNTSPRITVYNTTTVPYTKLTNPANLPGFNADDCAFSPDGTKLTVVVGGTATGARVVVYDTTTSPYTRLTDVSSYPTQYARGCAYSPDGTRLAVGANTSPYIYLYDTTTVPYTKLDNSVFSALPPNVVWGVAWSPNGNLLAVGTSSSPYIVFYDTSSSTYTKLSNPSTLPAGTVKHCAFSRDSKYLAAPHYQNGSRTLTIYDVSTSPFTAVVPENAPRGAASAGSYEATFSPDNSILVDVGYNTPYIVACYMGTARIMMGAQNVASTSVSGLGYSKTTTASGSTGTAVVVFSP